MMLLVALSGCLLLAEPPDSVKAQWPEPSVQLVLPDSPLSGSVLVEVVVDSRLDTTARLEIDGESVALDLAQAYRWETDELEPGDYELEATATDELGRQGTELVVVTVDAPPQVQWVEPAADATVDGRSVRVELEVSDDRPGTTIELDAGSEYVGDRSGPPYTFTWSTCDAQPGPVELVASVQDAGGNELALSRTVQFARPLAIAIQQPTGSPTPTDLVVAEVREVGTVAAVSIEVDGQAIGSTATPTTGVCAIACAERCGLYAVEWDASGLPEGPATVTATVTTTDGATATDSVVLTIDHDLDGDGHAGLDWGGPDCDDTRDWVFPGADEQCDGQDGDCDGTVDEGFDADGDGFISDACASGDDCDDTDASVNPDAVEICDNGFAEDCDPDPDGCRPSGSSSIVDADARISGFQDGQFFGVSAATGDVDSDGTDELLVGATGESSARGALYALQTPIASGTTITSASQRYFSGGPSEGLCGRAFAVGDIGAGASSDLIVGCPGASYGPFGVEEGVAYVFFGPLAGPVTASTADVTIYTDHYPFNSFGRSMAILGDRDGDGRRELAIADPLHGKNASSSGSSGHGQVYIYELSGLSSSQMLADAGASVILDNSVSGGALGVSMDAGYDTDGDGLPELLVGEPGAERAWLFDDSPTSGEHDAAIASQTVFASTGTLDSFGADVAFAGDVNSDGYVDVLITASGDSSNAVLGGAMYLFHGPLGFAESASNADAIASGATESAYWGWAAPAGDLDNDGHDDVAVAATGYGIDDNTGQITVLFGPFSGAITLEDEALQIHGAGPNEFVGAYALGRLSDINGDGRDDLAVGAPITDMGGGDTPGFLGIVYGSGY